MNRAGDCRLAIIPVFDRNTSIEALSSITVGIGKKKMRPINGRRREKRKRRTRLRLHLG